MRTIEAENLTEIRGGLSGDPFLLGYLGFLREVEANPQNYTWTMDWYYGR